MFWNTTRQLNAPERAPQVGVRLPIFNFKSSKFPISINFTNPLRTIIYPQMFPKLTHKFKKQPKT